MDWVVAFEKDTPAALIDDIVPDKLVKGGDYRPEEIAGYETVTAAGDEVPVIDLVAGCLLLILLAPALVCVVHAFKRCLMNRPMNESILCYG